MTDQVKTEPEKIKKSQSFAIIETGGKQYLVSEGQKIEVELLNDPEEGKELTLDALLVGNEKEVKVGKPTVEKAYVKAKILGEVKGDKLIVFKYKPKKNYRVKNGHRQKYTELEITKIAM